ncbi:MAG TPA: hypothetical protein VL096_00605, partial [Pirellulaceae bacterium]|nr:hypothetical protein [Pirellulaceae bacterium]
SLGLSPVAALAETPIETVLAGLKNPCGIAVQPESGTLFVSDSGHLKVLRIVGGKAEDVVTGFTKDVYGKGPSYEIGPLGLAFIDAETLVVGGGGKPDGEEQVQIFTVPAAGQSALMAESAKLNFMLPANGTIPAECNFFGVAATKNAIYVTSNGDDAQGWVAKSEIEGTKVKELTRFIATKKAVQVDAPVGITISPRGEVVIGQMGEIDTPADSLLTFYNANTGAKLLNLKTGLHDITALAYSPQGQLYALDFAWLDPAHGGLYQLVAEKKFGEQKLQAKKIVALDKPTAMVFGPDGALYITVMGTAGSGDKSPPGKLLKIAPGL